MKPKKVIPDQVYEGMYRLSFGKGIISDNMWNLTRANDMFKHYDEYIRREDTSIRMTILHAKKAVQKSLEVGS